MKKSFLFIFICCVLLSSCNYSNKKVLAKRIEKMKESSGNPQTIDEINDAIKLYEKDIEDILIKNGRVGIWYKILGTRYMDKKMYGQALACFQNALNIYPDNSTLYYYMGICAGYMSHTVLDFESKGVSEKRMKYLRMSEQAYLRAIQIDSRYVGALYGLSVLYVYELDESAKAIPYLENLLSIEKKNTDAMFVLARAYFSNYEFDKAIEMYDKIIQTTKVASVKADAEANKKTVLDESYGR